MPTEQDVFRTKTTTDLISGTDGDPGFDQNERKLRKEQTLSKKLDPIYDIGLAFAEPPEQKQIPVLTSLVM